MMTVLTVVAIVIIVIAYYAGNYYYEAYKRREALRRLRERQAGKADRGANNKGGFA